jgi:hypothetical protein
LLWRLINFRLFCSDDSRSWPREEKFWSDDCRLWPREEKINNHGCWCKHAHIPDNDYWDTVCFMSCEPICFLQLFLSGAHGIYVYFFSSTEHCAWAIIIYNLPKRVQILCHAHIICITVRENMFCDLPLQSAFERICNVMQLILVNIKWHIKWKYLIQKFHDICLPYYFKADNITKMTGHLHSHRIILYSINYLTDTLYFCLQCCYQSRVSIRSKTLSFYKNNMSGFLATWFKSNNDVNN